MWIRVASDCDLMSRLKRLEDFAYELNLSISFDCGGIFLIDGASDKEYHFLDLEAGVESLERAGSYIYQFPSLLEYKLCREVTEQNLAKKVKAEQNLKKEVRAKHCGSYLCRNLGAKNVYGQCSCNCSACREADQVVKRQREFDKEMKRNNAIK